MNCFVLVVEDDAKFSDELLEVLKETSEHCVATVARSREQAFAFLETKFFDIIILDLNIPTVEQGLDANPEHGHSVFGRAATASPGTPIIILTGSPAEDFIPAMLKHQQQVDIWGSGKKVGSVDFLKKYRFDEFPQTLGPMVASVLALGDVEVDRRGAELIMAHDRLVRIFAKRFGGTRCVITPVGGGLSGATVLRVRVTDAGGGLVHDAVAKLGSPEDVRDEGERFDNQVVRLDPAATPRKLATLDFGAKSQAGIFFGLADGYDRSAFSAAIDQALSASVVKNIAVVTERWRQGVSETRRTVRDIRARLVSDEQAERLIGGFKLDWAAAFEAKEIQCRWSCIHGDLHGENVLVSPTGATVLIDYGDVGDGAVSLDPVTLELSLLFHPKGPLKESDWPSTEQARAWGDVQNFAKGSPAEQFIIECRNWAHQAAAGKRECAASAYGYLLRQLKYEDTNKERVLALLMGVKKFYDAT